jgi:hypothetical protein
VSGFEAAADRRLVLMVMGLFTDRRVTENETSAAVDRGTQPVARETNLNSPMQVNLYTENTL